MRDRGQRYCIIYLYKFLNYTWLRGAAVISYAYRMPFFPGVLKEDYKKRFRAVFASRRRLKTAEATVNWLISKVRESMRKKADSCIARCNSSRSGNRSRAVPRWKIAWRAQLEKEKSQRISHTHIDTRVYATHVAGATSARTARVAAAAPRNSRVSPFMALICSRRYTRKCASTPGDAFRSARSG